MRVEVLTEDPELGRHLAASARGAANSALWAGCLDAPAGPWQPPEDTGGLGLLVLDGVAARFATVAGGRGAELLGRGDILRPWDDDRAQAPIPPETRWTVYRPLRMAVLDRHFTQQACAWPDVIIALHSRQLRRARWLAVLLALSEIRRLEPRLLALLWHLADRWGAVQPDGVTLDIGITHETLGALIGAGRPSVSRSLGRLRAAGAVTPRADGRGWVLHGEAHERVRDLLRPAPSEVPLVTADVVSLPL